MWIILFSEVSIILEEILFIPCKDSFFLNILLQKPVMNFIWLVRKYDIFQIFRWRYFYYLCGNKKKEERWQHRKEFY